MSRNHTLAYVPMSGRLYAFGLGGSGQLGVNSMVNRSLPCPVHGPFVPVKQEAFSPAPMKVNDEGSSLVVQRIFTGGDHCFIIYRPADVSYVCVCVCVCVHVCEREKKRESVCVCVCVCVWVREGVYVCVCVCLYLYLCVYVCVYEWECVCVCVRERECGCKCVCAC